MDTQSEISQMLTRLNAMQLPYNRKLFIVQIDDLLKLLRTLKQSGFEFLRGRSIQGKKVNSYHIYSSIENNLGTRLHLTTVYVDTSRTGYEAKCSLWMSHKIL